MGGQASRPEFMSGSAVWLNVWCPSNSRISTLECGVHYQHNIMDLLLYRKTSGRCFVLPSAISRKQILSWSFEVLRGPVMS